LKAQLKHYNTASTTKYRNLSMRQNSSTVYIRSHQKMS